MVLTSRTAGFRLQRGKWLHPLRRSRRLKASTTSSKSGRPDYPVISQRNIIWNRPTVATATATALQRPLQPRLPPPLMVVVVLRGGSLLQVVGTIKNDHNALRRFSGSTPLGDQSGMFLRATHMLLTLLDTSHDSGCQPRRFCKSGVAVVSVTNSYVRYLDDSAWSTSADANSMHVRYNPTTELSSRQHSASGNLQPCHLSC